MFNNTRFPYMNTQQLNLDWLLNKIKEILKFMPIDTGNVGDVLQRGTSGAAWQPLTSVTYDIDGMNTAAEVAASDEIPIYDVSAGGNYKTTVQDILDLTPVSSVNGKTGTVVLDASDVGALPDDYAPPVTSVNGQTGTIVLDASDVGALPSTYTAPVTSVNGQTGDVTVSGGVYSVNSKVGAVVLDASDVGALPSTYTPPVTSVNGQTGAVVISTGQAAPTLLWTNERPTQDFTGQTLSLTLSTYNFIIIEYGVDGVGTLLTSLLPVPTLPPPEGYSSYNELQGIYVTGSNGRMAKRSAQISTTGIVFGSGTRFDNYNSGNTTDNSVCIPTRIWGL